MAEFVIMLPVLALLLLAIVEFGIAFNRAQALHASAREGARIGSLRDTTQTEIRDRVNDSLIGINFDAAPVIGVVPNIAQPCFGRPGQTVEVNATANYTVSLPLIPSLTLNLNGDGTFRCEGG